MAPIPTDGRIELHYLIPHIPGMRNQQSFLRKSAYNILDLKYGLEPPPTTPINHELAEAVLQQTQQIVNQSQQALMQAYIRH